MLIHIKCGRTVSGRKAPGRALDHAGGGSVNKGNLFLTYPLTCELSVR